MISKLYILMYWNPVPREKGAKFERHIHFRSPLLHTQPSKVLTHLSKCYYAIHTRRCIFKCPQCFENTRFFGEKTEYHGKYLS